MPFHSINQIVWLSFSPPNSLVLAVGTAGGKKHIHCSLWASCCRYWTCGPVSCFFLISLNLVFVLVRPPNWLPTAVGMRLEHGLGILLSAADWAVSHHLFLSLQYWDVTTCRAYWFLFIYLSPTRFISICVLNSWGSGSERLKINEAEKDERKHTSWRRCNRVELTMSLMIVFLYIFHIYYEISTHYNV